MKKNDNQTDSLETALRQLRPVSGAYIFEPEQGRRILNKKRIAIIAGGVCVLAASIFLAFMIDTATEKEVPGIVESNPSNVAVEIIVPEIEKTKISEQNPPTMRKRFTAILKEMNVDSKSMVSAVKCETEYPVIEITVAKNGTGQPRDASSSKTRSKTPYMTARSLGSRLLIPLTE